LYNPKQHPYFDQDGGRTIYFEGTYTQAFSGSEETATPRYDYNQIMYRLDLGDPRLALPAPIYELREGEDDKRYLPGEAVAEAGRWDDVESAAFYAIEPGRGDDRMVAVYAEQSPDGHTRLTTEPHETTARPLFLAMAPAGKTTSSTHIVPLYEYRRADSGHLRYSTQSQLDESGWKHAEQPLCRVWKAPTGPLLVDGQARPSNAL
jgi:hypothetical protein